MLNTISQRWQTTAAVFLIAIVVTGCISAPRTPPGATRNTAFSKAEKKYVSKQIMAAGKKRGLSFNSFHLRHKPTHGANTGQVEIWYARPLWGDRWYPYLVMRAKAEDGTPGFVIRELSTVMGRKLMQ